MKKPLLAIIVIAGLGLAWWLGSPLFIDKEVNEELPEGLEEIALDGPIDPASDDVKDAIAVLEDETEAEAERKRLEAAKDLQFANTNLEEQLEPEMMDKFKEAMAEMEDKAVEDDMPELGIPAPGVVGSGKILDVAHHGSGTVQLIRQNATDAIVRLVDLDVSNGPDLRVLLSENSGVQSSPGLGNYIELGKLKGNKGTQNYVVPAGTDLSKYKSVVIYCKPFHVVFNSADLN